MTVESRELVSRLPTKEGAEMELRYPDGSLVSVSPLSVRESILLADAGVICGQLNKHGYLRYLRLLVSVAAVRRLLGRKSKLSAERLPIAEDNFTVRRASPGRYFEHINKVSEAYAR